MKKIKIITILLIMISFVVSGMAQSPAPGTTRDMKKRVNEEEAKKEKIKSAFEVINYFEIKIIRIEEKNIIKSDESSLSEIREDSPLFYSKKRLLKLFKQIQDNRVDVAAEFGKNGFKIISHSFALDKENNEIHYYTIEL